MLRSSSYTRVRSWRLSSWPRSIVAAVSSGAGGVGAYVSEAQIFCIPLYGVRRGTRNVLGAYGVNLAPQTLRCLLGVYFCRTYRPSRRLFLVRPTETPTSGLLYLQYIGTVPTVAAGASRDNNRDSQGVAGSAECRKWLSVRDPDPGRGPAPSPGISFRRRCEKAAGPSHPSSLYQRLRASPAHSPASRELHESDRRLPLPRTVP